MISKASQNKKNASNILLLITFKIWTNQSKMCEEKGTSIPKGVPMLSPLPKRGSRPEKRNLALCPVSKNPSMP